jgi:FkbM family methyltransferase
MINFLRKIKHKVFPKKLEDIWLDKLKSNNNLKNPESILQQIQNGDKIIKYKYKNHTLHIFNEAATIYHIVNSTEKLEKLAASCEINDEGVCLDIGANVGLFSYFYKYFNPNSTIHLFEPDERLIPVIELNMLTFQNYFIHNIALANHNGKESFYINNQSSQTNSKNKECVEIFGTGEQIKEIKINATTLKSFVNSKNIKNISCLKIDVQGAEYEILADSPEILVTTKQLLLEVCFLMEDAIPTINIVSPYFKNSTPINSIIMGADLKFYN